MDNYNNKETGGLWDAHRLIFKGAVSFEDNPLASFFWIFVAVTVFLGWGHFWGGVSGRQCETGIWDNPPLSLARKGGCTVKSIADTLYPPENDSPSNRAE